MERLGGAALDAVLDGLLARVPRARVVAIGANGLFVPMPTSVPLQGHQAISGPASALELVVPEDIVTVIETWESARAGGAATATVHPAVAPGLRVELQFVDATHRHGVYLGFVLGVPDGSDTQAPAAESALRPRYGVLHKNELAVATTCDESMLRMMGWTPGDVVGRRTLEFVHPDDHPRAIANWMDLLGRPGATRRVRLRHRHADGGWVWFEVTNHNLLNDPAHGYVLAEMIDISEEMAATEALRAGGELLRRLTDALPVGVVQFAADGAVVYRNDRLGVILGRDVPPGQRVGGEQADAEIAGLAGLAGPVAGVLAGGDDADLEVTHDRPDGGARRIHVSLRALRGPEGEVTGAIGCLSDVTEAAQLREELARRASYDALTGCLSRGALMERLDALLAAGEPVTALFIDLDGFKQVNDRHGHAVGDALLRHVGGRLLAQARPGDLVGRLGGDEFLIVTASPRDDASAAAAADAAAAAIGAPIVVDGVRLTARASVGVARSGEVADADALVAAADEGMYRTKTERRAAARS